MPTTITLRCHACKAHLKAPIQLLGECRPCPACNMPVRVRIQPRIDLRIAAPGPVRASTAET